MTSLKMKKYKLLTNKGYESSGFTKGNIYKEIKKSRMKFTVKKYVEDFPEDWELEEVVEFNAKEYLVNILNNENLCVELEDVEELKKLFEIINRLKFSLNKKLETKEHKIKVTIAHGKQVRFNLSKDKLFGTENNFPFIKFSEIVNNIEKQLKK